MSLCTAWRGARPPGPGAGGSMGGPTTTCTFTGLMKRAPLGMAASELPMPTGTMGTPARAAT